MQLLFDNYVAVLLAGIIGSILVLSALLASRLLAPYSESRQKRTTYECGMVPIGRVRTQVHIRYYLFAILFLIFDVEAVFLFPWAVIFMEQKLEHANVVPFYSMMLFLGVLFFAVVYAWKKGVLEWRK